ncbi:MAG: hypothetical protein IPJ65_28540 [Archangiaceae bacterium]|nr:hypothetical protein [Archangiaceae bacterium]
MYCCIHEAGFGGYRNFHVEHLRPKSRFRSQENKYSNLFYACAVCNALKGNDWPKAKELVPDVVCYPDPSVVNYATLFSADGDSSVSGTTLAGKYLVEKLYLNRPQLLMERRHTRVLAELEQEMSEIDSVIESEPGDVAALKALITEFTATTRLLAGQREVRPYLPADVDR